MWDQGSKGRDQGSEPRDQGSGIRAPGSGIRKQKLGSKQFLKKNRNTTLNGHRYFGRCERC